MRGIFKGHVLNSLQPIIVLLSLVLCQVTFSQNENNQTTSASHVRYPILKDSIGKEITLIGEAINMKLGAAILLSDGQFIRLANKSSWPRGFYKGHGKKNKKIKITGVIRAVSQIQQIDEHEFKADDSMLTSSSCCEAGNHFMITDFTWEKLSKFSSKK